jgi:hypothetical protein
MTPIKPLIVTKKNALREINIFINGVNAVLTKNTDKPFIVICHCKYENDNLKKLWQASICTYISAHSPYKYNESFFTTEIQYNDCTGFLYCINCTLEQYEDINNVLEQQQQSK